MPARRHPADVPNPAPDASERARRRRLAAAREGPAARVLVCERETRGPIEELLRRLHYSVTACRSLEDVLRENARDPVEVTIVELDECREECVRLLQLLRRASPKMRIVLVLEDPTPAARLATLTVRPFYVAVPPVGTEEMAAVLRDAVAAGRKRT